jgi:hypothetical protein
MGDERDRDRMVFETSELMKRAIRIRAALEGVKPADVVNAALAAYLDKEIALAQERLKEGGPAAGGAPQRPARRRKEDRP